MPIFEEFRDAVANENLKVGASWPAQRLQHSTMDFDRLELRWPITPQRDRMSKTDLITSSTQG